MKKLLLLTILLAFFAFMAVSQPVSLPVSTVNHGIRTEYIKPAKDLETFNTGINPYVSDPARQVDEHQLGTTYYDLQSNYLLQNRICFNPSAGDIGVVWTRGIQATAFSDRGTGYNYFNGSDWLPEPDARIEDERTGWPNYAFQGNGEIVIAHLASGLKISKRPQKGTGTWTYSTLIGPTEAPDLTWPRMITSGPNGEYVHLIANTYDAYMGQTEALLYYRSSDGGVTWDIQHELLDGTGSDYYTEIGADAYSWAEAKGDTIAFLVASAWHDMFAMKSYDNGDTWEKVLIWEHPYPFFDWESTVADTFFCVDNSASIALGDDGRIHVVFGINRVLHVELGTTFYYFPGVDGIGYWNEDMPSFSNDLSALAPPQYGYPTSEMVEDYNYIGYTQDVNGNGVIDFLPDLLAYRTLGISTMPSLTLGDEGDIYVIFASTTEGYDNFTYNYKHVWARGSCDGETWSPFLDLTSDIIHIFDEFYFPQLAPTSDDFLHMVYNADATPGLAFSEQHDWQENRLIYAKIPKAEFCPIGIGDPAESPALEVSQNYPNPARELTYVRVELDRPTPVMLEVTDLSGRKVRILEEENAHAGAFYFKIDTEHLPSGIYFYRVKAGNESVTRKMIIE